jgi:glycosyltransferase involved in cell wall biosynthesis
VIDRLAGALRRGGTASPASTGSTRTDAIPDQASAAPPTIHVGFYSPANLNTMDGSAIWVESAIRTLIVDPRVRLTVVLKAPERRAVVTSTIRGLDRVTLIPRPDDAPPLDAAGAIDRLAEIDAHDPFDIVLIRGYEVGLEAARRATFVGRLWACYVLEPERDLDDTEHRSGLRAIVGGASRVLVQSQAMADLFASAVPDVAARILLLPPAVPPPGGPVAATPGSRRSAHRLVYTGKFHPFYRIADLLDAFVELHRRDRRLTFHLVGDKVFQPPDDPESAPALRRRFRTTDGVVWHGAKPRPEVMELLREGGLALSVWDYDHGSRTNDLVISTKLLDYAVAGLPVLLTRTRAQEALLGSDYPLFLAPGANLASAIRAALDDTERLAIAAAATRAMAAAFSYPVVAAGLRPAIDAVAVANAGRPALPSAHPGSRSDPTGSTTPVTPT